MVGKAKGTFEQQKFVRKISIMHAQLIEVSNSFMHSQTYQIASCAFGLIAFFIYAFTILFRMFFLTSNPTLDQLKGTYFAIFWTTFYYAFFFVISSVGEKTSRRVRSMSSACHSSFQLFF